ncbi:hypothetical protein RK21_05680 [Pseudomonas plecoglossicida]|nr:hypothetical protein RK21_05680 [Pseudomonas plecoglossicida]
MRASPRRAAKQPQSKPQRVTCYMNYLFPLTAILIWAGNTVVTKMSAGAIHPAEIGFYR